MSFDRDKLYALLPAIYRLRDSGQGGSLQEMLAVIAEQAAVLEENLAQLYDDQFIETCAAWVIPYIGDLIGYRSLHAVTPRISSPRAEVANTIGYRRRKGTAAVLEQLARDVTGWDARVVEFFQLLTATQYMNHIRPGHVQSPDLRLWEPLASLHTPFDRLPHTVDVRRIASGRGRYNIPNVGIFLWRLGAHSLTDSPAFEVDQQRYLFSPLGHDIQLFTDPQTEEEITHLAGPLNVPMPIGRRMLDQSLGDYYGKNKTIFLSGVEDPKKVLICDLSDQDGAGTTWAHSPPSGKIAIDPVLGRLAFAEPQAKPPRVTFHYGFSADMGGGEYDREASFDAELESEGKVIQVPQDQPTLQLALDFLQDDHGVIEITDSDRYGGTPVKQLAAGQKVEIRAANKHRPTLALEGDWQISGSADSEVTLNGLLISGGAIRVPASADGPGRLLLRHCTLVPGLALFRNGTPQHPASPSLIVDSSDLAIEIDHAIVGGLRVAQGGEVQIQHSIVDATAETGVAYAAPDDSSAGGKLQFENSTVVGKVHTVSMELASNTIFFSRVAKGEPWPAPVLSERKQEGCVRFSYLPLESQVPRRYYCQPNLAIQQAIGSAKKKKPDLTPEEETRISTEIQSRIKPGFTALTYGRPGYAQLHLSCPVEIREGADDSAEMGVFHDLYQPQREINLRVRLDEYLRFDLEAGIFYVT